METLHDVAKVIYGLLLLALVYELITIIMNEFEQILRKMSGKVVDTGVNTALLKAEVETLKAQVVELTNRVTSTDNALNELKEGLASLANMATFQPQPAPTAVDFSAEIAALDTI